MPNLPFQIITTAADLVIFVFAGYYMLKIRKREKELEKKEKKIDTGYHQVIDDALSRERKILEDAAKEADEIITDAEYVNKSSTEEINRALHDLAKDIEKEAAQSAQTFTTSYATSLKNLTAESLTEFQTIVKTLVADLQKQTEEFRQTLLPKMEQELEGYKQARLKQTEEMTTRIVQKASQEILNKVIPLSDHQNLVTEALEKAKKEGVFN